MQKRYQAVLWLRDPKADYQPSWAPHPIGCFRSPRRAARAVNQALSRHHVKVTTNALYHHDHQRAPGGAVVDLKTKRELEIIEPHMQVVPSVGELGYW